MNLKYINMHTTYNVQHHHERSKSSQEPQLSQLGYRSDQNEHQSNIYLPGVSAGFWGSELRKARSNFNQLAETHPSWKPVTWRWSWISWSWFVLSWEEGGFDFGKDWIGSLRFPYIDRVSSEGSESDVAVRFKRVRNKVRVVWESSEVEGLLIETRILGFGPYGVP